MTSTKQSVLIVGAGVSGVFAAQTLASAGVSVVIKEKSRGVGGRMHSRSGASFGLPEEQGILWDQGAQFFTVRSEQFQRIVEDQWDARVWCRGFESESPDGHPRYRSGAGGMKGLVEQSAAKLPEDLVEMQFYTRVEKDDLLRLAQEYRAVLVTAPLPQALQIIPESLEIPQELKNVVYGETVSLHCTLKEGASSPVASPGGKQKPRPNVHMITDERQKGNSKSLALTVHGDVEFSRKFWDSPDEDVKKELAAPFLDDVDWWRVKRWRYAIPQTLVKERFHKLAETNIYLCGDAFGQLGIEGAVLSGIHTANAVLQAPSKL